MRREPPSVYLRALMLSAATIGLMALAGCSSSVLDSLDPTGLISRAPADSKVAGADQSAPNLGSVPARPPAPARADREGVTRALTADRQNAQYTDEVFRRTPEAPPPPPAPAPAPAQAPLASAPTPMATPPAPAPVASAPPAPPPPTPAPTVPPPPAPPPAVVAQAPLPPPAPAPPSPAIPPPSLPRPSAPTASSAPLSPPALPPPVMDAPQPRAAAPVDQPTSPNRPAASIDSSGAVTPAGGYLPSRSPTASPPSSPAQPAGAGYARQPLPAAPPAPPVLDGRASALPPAALPAPSANSSSASPSSASPSGANLDAMLRQTFPDVTPPRTVLPGSEPTLGAATPAAVLYFQGGSVALSSEDRQILGEVAKAVRQRGASVQVIGHASREASDADPIRRRSSMLDLSARRAQAVATELNRLGVSTTQIDVQAMGDARPEFDDTKATGVAGNRRVELLIRL